MLENSKALSFPVDGNAVGCYLWFMNTATDMKTVKALAKVAYPAYKGRKFRVVELNRPYDMGELLGRRVTSLRGGRGARDGAHAGAKRSHRVPLRP